MYSSAVQMEDTLNTNIVKTVDWRRSVIPHQNVFCTHPVSLTFQPSLSTLSVKLLQNPSLSHLTIILCKYSLYLPKRPCNQCLYSLLCPKQPLSRTTATNNPFKPRPGGLISSLSALLLLSALINMTTARFSSDSTIPFTVKKPILAFREYEKQLRRSRVLLAAFPLRSGASRRLIFGFDVDEMLRIC